MNDDDTNNSNNDGSNNNNNNKIIIIIIIIIAVETLGPINREGREFLLELGRRGAGVSAIQERLFSCFNDFSMHPAL